jgi:hypothetical protein
MRSWICLSNIVSIGSGSASPPYTPDSEIVPPRRTMSIAEYSAVRRSTPALSMTFSPTASGSIPTIVCAIFAPAAPT